MRIIGTEDNSDPEKNYRLWEECVHPDDMPLIKEAIESTQHNIRAEVKYRWRHKTRRTLHRLQHRNACRQGGRLRHHIRFF